MPPNRTSSGYGCFCPSGSPACSIFSFRTRTASSLPSPPIPSECLQPSSGFSYSPGRPVSAALSSHAGIGRYPAPHRLQPKIESPGPIDRRARHLSVQRRDRSLGRWSARVPISDRVLCDLRSRFSIPGRTRFKLALPHYRVRWAEISGSVTRKRVLLSGCCPGAFLRVADYSTDKWTELCFSL